jgi:hypothetical protein
LRVSPLLPHNQDKQIRELTDLDIWRDFGAKNCTPEQIRFSLIFFWITEIDYRIYERKL